MYSAPTVSDPRLAVPWPSDHGQQFYCLLSDAADWWNKTTDVELSVMNSYCLVHIVHNTKESCKAPIESVEHFLIGFSCLASLKYDLQWNDFMATNLLETVE